MPPPSRTTASLGRARAALRRGTHHSAVRYLVVGVGTFALDLGLLTLLFRVCGLPLWLATAIAFWSTVAINFALQRRYTFKAAAPVGAAAWRYGALLAANSVANVLVIEIFERTGLGYVAGKVSVTVLQAGWNYLAYRHWVFAAPRSAKRDTSGHTRDEGTDGTPPSSGALPR